jgi:hypothetical protein
MTSILGPKVSSVKLEKVCENKSNLLANGLGL